MVLHPARRLAPSHGVHDHCAYVFRLFSYWIHHLSCPRWREIFRIHGLARGILLSDPRFARTAGVRDAAVGDFDACSGFSSSVGPAQADRALDNPDLALCVCHRSSRLFDPVPMVPSASPLTAPASGVISGLPPYAAYRHALKTTEAVSQNRQITEMSKS